MTEIGFYHLTRTGAEQALPQLLGRTLAAGQRAVVLCGTDERVEALDRALWECEDPDWLPHGTKRSGNADLQPIWLTEEDAAAEVNEADFADGTRTATSTTTWFDAEESAWHDSVASSLNMPALCLRDGWAMVDDRARPAYAA